MSGKRIIHAPRGGERTCKGWHQEAAMRMLMNNLDPDVAENPDQLVVYGGTGRAARSWEAFDAIVRSLGQLENDETLLIQSGKPIGKFRTHDEAPRVLIANSNLVGQWNNYPEFNRLERMGLTMYGQMTAGSWIYIGSQGIVQGTFETFAAAGRKHFGGSLDGKLILTGGLGGMGGAQPLAATMNGAVFLGIDASTPATAAMVQATRTIPVIFVLVADPVGSGFVASLPRPGGNVTGFTPIVGSLGGKWAELVKEIAPGIAQITLLYNPQAAPFIESYSNPFKAAATSLGMQAIIAPINDVRELETLVTIQAGKPNSGLVVFPDAFTEFHREEIVSLIVRHRVPAVNWSRSFADGGGLISYGPYLVDEHRRAATYADRILKGEKPADLPVQAPTKYELAINLKTAKALGLTVPPALLASADDLIE